MRQFTIRSTKARVAALALAASSIASLGASGILGNVSAASAADTPKASVTLKLSTTRLGDVITDGQGMTLYMFLPDAHNVSNCEGQCLAAWPPLMLGKGETLANVATDSTLRRSLLGVALRVDGSQQVTYEGRPLYYWFRDSKPGDVNGQWVANAWWVLRADGEPNAAR